MNYVEPPLYEWNNWAKVLWVDGVSKLSAHGFETMLLWHCCCGVIGFLNADLWWHCGGGHKENPKEAWVRWFGRHTWVGFAWMRRAAMDKFLFFFKVARFGLKRSEIGPDSDMGRYGLIQSDMGQNTVLKKENVKD